MIQFATPTSSHIIEVREVPRGHRRVYRINGQGGWRSENATDEAVKAELGSGVYELHQAGERVGSWVQADAGHALERWELIGSGEAA